MYKIKRNRLVEELEIEDNGKFLNLKVDINVDSILKRYTQAQMAISQASLDAKNANSKDDLTKAENSMGDAILSLFEIVFGEEQTKQIIDFYEDKTMEMLGEIAPFINDVVTPRVAEAQQKIIDSYKQVSKRGK